MSGLTVVKVGGSLCAEPARLRTLLGALADGVHGPCVIVPGGGAFADAVRAAQAREGFDDTEAHRRALDAMGRMADVFCGLEPRLVRTTDLPSELPSLPRRRGRESVGGDGEHEMPTPFWDPVSLRAGHPDIPETWDVTSDSLALWLARRTDAARCILVKSADAPMGADPHALARIGLVDAAFPRFAAGFSGRIVIRGPNGETPVRARDAA